MEYMKNHGHPIGKSKDQFVKLLIELHIIEFYQLKDTQEELFPEFDFQRGGQLPQKLLLIQQTYQELIDDQKNTLVTFGEEEEEEEEDPQQYDRYSFIYYLKPKTTKLEEQGCLIYPYIKYFMFNDTLLRQMEVVMKQVGELLEAIPYQQGKYKDFFAKFLEEFDQFENIPESVNYYLKICVKISLSFHFQDQEWLYEKVQHNLKLSNLGQTNNNASETNNNEEQKKEEIQQDENEENENLQNNILTINNDNQEDQMKQEQSEVDQKFKDPHSGEINDVGIMEEDEKENYQEYDQENDFEEEIQKYFKNVNNSY